MENKKIAECHDCQKKIEIEDKEIKNGVILLYKDGDKNIEVFKCNDCFKKNPALTNYKNCEVYSRIVGYLRPVQQWNVGKQQEFKERENYKLSQ
jgi:anaerobic ribonucleoside-triphosphate reductase